MYPLRHESKCPSGEDQNDMSNQQLVGTVDRSESISSFTSACHIIPYLGTFSIKRKDQPHPIPPPQFPPATSSPSPPHSSSHTLSHHLIISARTHAVSSNEKVKKSNSSTPLGEEEEGTKKENNKTPQNLKDGADVRSFPRLRTAIQNQHSPDRQSAQISREGFEERVHTQGITAIQL